MTNQWALEAVDALLEFLESLLFVCRALYNRANLALADIFENGPELVGSRRILGDVQFEVRTMGVRLMSVVAGLVLGGRFCSICRGLLQDGSSPDRSRRTSLVKEGDNVEGLVLFSIVSVMIWSTDLINIEVLTIVPLLTNRNMT